MWTVATATTTMSGHTSGDGRLVCESSEPWLAERLTHWSNSFQLLLNGHNRMELLQRILTIADCRGTVTQSWRTTMSGEEAEKDRTEQHFYFYYETQPAGLTAHKDSIRCMTSKTTISANSLHRSNQSHTTHTGPLMQGIDHITRILHKSNTHHTHTGPLMQGIDHIARILHKSNQSHTLAPSCRALITSRAYCTNQINHTPHTLAPSCRALITSRAYCTNQINHTPHTLAPSCRALITSRAYCTNQSHTTHTGPLMQGIDHIARILHKSNQSHTTHIGPLMQGIDHITRILHKSITHHTHWPPHAGH